MKNSGSKFYKNTEIQNILELTLTFVLAESNTLILQLGQLSPAGNGTRWVMLSAVVQRRLNSVRSAEVLCNPKESWHEFPIFFTALAPVLVSICLCIHRS